MMIFNNDDCHKCKAFFPNLGIFARNFPDYTNPGPFPRKGEQEHNNIVNCISKIVFR